MNLKKNLSGYALIASAALALVGLVFYIVTSTTGYLANTEVNALPIVFSLLAILLSCVGFILGGKMSGWVNTAIILVVSALVVASLVGFVDARVDVVADVFFIPVNFPASEGVAANASIVGAVFYALSVIALAVSGFASDRIGESK